MPLNNSCSCSSPKARDGNYTATGGHASLCHQIPVMTKTILVPFTSKCGNADLDEKCKEEIGVAHASPYSTKYRLPKWGSRESRRDLVTMGRLIYMGYYYDFPGYCLVRFKSKQLEPTVGFYKHNTTMDRFWVGASVNLFHRAFPITRSVV